MRSFKQRQVNLLTKSSLRLPTSCTVVYIAGKSTGHKQGQKRVELKGREL